MKLSAAVLAGLLAGSSSLVAQSTPTPYAGLNSRPIKALSAEEIAGLKRGDGLGFALTAELNGLPGPLHVVELADRLGLTPAQREAAERALRDGKAEFARLGAEVVRLEAEFDQLFASGRATPDNVRRLAGQIGAARGELRAAHLNRHLEIAPLLSDEQKRRYAELRGYAVQGATPAQPGGQHDRHGGHHGRPHQHRH